MITFMNVQGFVAIDNRAGKQTIAPWSGMTMPLVGADCIIATGPGGRAVLTINNQRLELKERSFLRIAPDGRSFVQKHQEQAARDLRLFFGRLWALAMDKVGHDREWLRYGNAAVGVRG